MRKIVNRTYCVQTHKYVCSAMTAKSRSGYDRARAYRISRAIIVRALCGSRSREGRSRGSRRTQSGTRSRWILRPQSCPQVRSRVSARRRVGSSPRPRLTAGRNVARTLGRTSSAFTSRARARAHARPNQSAHATCSCAPCPCHALAACNRVEAPIGRRRRIPSGSPTTTASERDLNRALPRAFLCSSLQARRGRRRRE